MKNVRIIQELHRIAKENNGLLSAEAVVEVASNPKSILHSRFEWDDDDAAHEYRLWQARQLISVAVEVLPGTNQSVQTFVSLSTDRKGGKGYRTTVSVMSDADMRAQLLNDALHDLNTFQRKYSELRQLSEVFSAIRKVRKSA